MKCVRILIFASLALLAAPGTMQGMQTVKGWWKGATDQQIAEAKECGICKDDFEESNLPLTILKCDPKVPHIFHSDCLNNWISAQPKATCPQCRKAISADQLSLLQKLNKIKKNTVDNLISVTRDPRLGSGFITAGSVQAFALIPQIAKLYGFGENISTHNLVLAASVTSPFALLSAKKILHVMNNTSMFAFPIVPKCNFKNCALATGMFIGLIKANTNTKDWQFGLAWAASIAMATYMLDYESPE